MFEFVPAMSDSSFPTIEHPSNLTQKFPLFLCWIEGLPRATAIYVPGADEEEAAHLLTEHFYHTRHLVPPSICVEVNNVITIFEVHASKKTVFELNRRREP